MPEPAALVDAVATELNNWPGARIEPRSDGVTVVRWRHAELGSCMPTVASPSCRS